MMHAPAPPRHARGGLATALLRLALAVTALAPLAASPTRADVLFDFEGPYLRDVGHTIKDHSMVFDGTQWHCFYIRGLEGMNGNATEREIGHAVSTDLRDWIVLSPVLEADPGSWDGRNVWAPQVLPSLDGTGWEMFYTGVESTFLQRLGRATSTDLFTWTKDPGNPVLEPDPAVYVWSESLAVPELSAFRDPYVFEHDGQYHVLDTALIQDGNTVRGYRGAIHHATSPDRVNWTAVDPLAVNNSTQGVWREIESVQLIEHGGRWHLFFTLFGITGVQWVSNASFDTGWNLANAVLIDTGIAAELTPIDADTWLFSRHAPAQHFVNHPDAGEIFYTLRADTLRFGPNNAPVVVRDASFARDWPEREGDAFLAAPTFGDNQLERGEPRANLIGNGFLSSREFWGGPLSGVGGIGGSIGNSPTGRIRSRWFTVSPQDQIHRFLLGGMADPGCRIELQERVSVAPDSFEVVVRRSMMGPGGPGLVPRQWPVDDLHGATVRFEVIDESATGWISVDHITVEQDIEPTAAPSPVLERGRLAAPSPNPFNPRTTLRFEVLAASEVSLEVHDLRGRRVRTLAQGRRDAGAYETVWDGRDDARRDLASGVYLVRLVVDGASADFRKLVLVR